MEVFDENIKLSQAQIYLLKNLSALADIPVTAKELFKFLNINENIIVQYFDALHSLVPQWLEYKNLYYIFPKDKAQKFIRLHTIRVNDLYRLLTYFKKLFISPNANNIKILERYEPYVLSILNNFKQPSVLLAQLHLSYAQYLSYKEKYDEALLTIQQAIGTLQQLTPNSPILVQAWNEMAFIYLRKNNIDKTIQLALKAKETLAKIPQSIPELKTNTEFILGEASFKAKNYSQAIHHYLHVLELLGKNPSNQHRLLVYIYLQISYSYRYQQQYEKSLHYIQLAENNLRYLNNTEINIFGEQIRLQKKAISGLSILTKLKAKFLTYSLIVIATLVGVLMIIMMFKLLLNK